MILWATEVWPYINGKALMSGVRLVEMEASEMLDVIHYLMEEDSTYLQDSQADSRSNVRSKMYEFLYGRNYQFKRAAPNVVSRDFGSPAYASDDTFNLDDVQPVDPRNPFPLKPYIPPTPFDPDAANPFPGLDGPLG